MRGRATVAVAVLCGVQFVDVMGVTSAITALPAMLEAVAAPAGSGPMLASAYATSSAGCCSSARNSATVSATAGSW